MIRNHSRALGTAALAFGAISLVGAQGWPSLCDDPSTTALLWSTTYNGFGVGTQMFGTVLTVAGTVAYELCPPQTFTADAAGGIGFLTGNLASVQTTQDDLVALTFGGAFDFFINPTTGQVQYLPAGARANWAYFATVRRDALTGDEAGNFTKFGTSAIDTFFDGASDRYIIAAGTQDNIRVDLRIDGIGDASRVRWRLTNQGAATNIGLWFGQWVTPIGNYTLDVRPITFINVPGYKPQQINRRFKRIPRPEFHVYPMPPYADLCVSQSRAYEGLRIITDATGPDGAFPDQTPVDGLDIALDGWLMGGRWANDGMFPFARNSDEEFDRFRDINIVGNVAYVQKWFPRPVAASDRPVNERTVEIVGYYKTTWGDSNFSPPYNVTGDAPKVIATQNDNPFEFQQDSYTLRVYIDNARGFTEVEKELKLENVRVQLQLPQGLADAANASRRVITKTIPVVDPKGLKFVDFQIQALDTAYGILPYSVEITPQTTSPRKVITGNIVVGSKPYLLIRDNANLVGSPWNYANGSWASILGSDPMPLRPDIDFQAYTWDAEIQQYVLQTGPQRGRGTWIISNVNTGFKPLAGSPSQPQDMQTGADQMILKSGWNLIANPYSYPIQLGQIVGVSAQNPQQSFTFQELVDQGVLGSALSYWDDGTQSYKFISSAQDVIQPNTGYWLNVLTAGDVTIAMPPVFLPFIPAGTGGISGPLTRNVSDSLWSLNLVAKQGTSVDDSNRLGELKDGVNPKKSLVFEPPIGPMRNAISAAIKRESNKGFTRMAQMFQNDSQKKPFIFNVHTKRSGNVTVTWPEIKNVPTKYGLTLQDPVTGAKVNMRTSASYTFSASANSMRDLKVAVSVAVGPLVENVSAFRTGSGANDPIEVGYKLNTGATTTVRILQNGTAVRTLVNKINESTGAHKLLWNLIDSRGNRVRSGVYQAEVSVTVGDKTESKVVSFVLR